MHCVAPPRAHCVSDTLYSGASPCGTQAWVWVEGFFCLIFLAEVALRFVAAMRVGEAVGYWKQPMVWIDIAARWRQACP